MCGVAVGVIVGGVTTAWLTVMCRFPGRRLFEWALLLPMAVPAYVMAYAYTDLLQFAGPVQSGCAKLPGGARASTGFRRCARSAARSSCCRWCCIPTSTCSRVRRSSSSPTACSKWRACRGYGAWGTFLQVALPLARPGIVAGTALALMETLADYGTVAYFGVQTFTTGIFRAWFSLGDHVAAAQLSAILLGFVFLVLLHRARQRGAARFHTTSHRKRLRNVYRLRGCARGCCGARSVLLPLVFGFLLPARIMLKMALTCGRWQFGARYVHADAQYRHAGGDDGDAGGAARADGRLTPVALHARRWCASPIALPAWVMPCPARSSPSAC